MGAWVHRNSGLTFCIKHALEQWLGSFLIIENGHIHRQVLVALRFPGLNNSFWKILNFMFLTNPKHTFGSLNQAKLRATASTLLRVPARASYHCSVTLGKLLNVFIPYLCLLLNGDSDGSYLMEWLLRIKDVKTSKMLRIVPGL